MIRAAGTSTNRWLWEATRERRATPLVHRVTIRQFAGECQHPFWPMLHVHCPANAVITRCIHLWRVPCGSFLWHNKVTSCGRRRHLSAPKASLHVWHGGRREYYPHCSGCGQALGRVICDPVRKDAGASVTYKWQHLSHAYAYMHWRSTRRPSHLPRLNAGSRPHRPRPQAVACSAAVAPPPAHAECAQLHAATPSGVTAAASVPEQVADNAARNVAAAVSPELHNQPGLNGLSACGTSGLTTVSLAQVCVVAVACASGCFVGSV